VIERANAARRARDFPRAETVLRAHLQLQPNDAGVLAVLGAVLGQTRRGDQALYSFERAWKLRPGDPEIASMFGAILVGLSQPARAIELLSQVPAGHQSWCNAQFNTAAANVQLEDFEAAEFTLRHLLSLGSAACSVSPPLLATTLAGILPRLLRADEARQLLRSTLARYPGDLLTLAVLTPMCVYADDITTADLDELHIMFGGALARSQQGSIPLPRRGTALERSDGSAHSRRLHIGFLSADFRDHAVMRFWLSLAANLDRSKVALTCVELSHRHDSVTQRCQEVAASFWSSDHDSRANPDSRRTSKGRTSAGPKRDAAGWFDISAMNDGEAALALHSQEFDILVDLSGHTQNSRLQLLTRRLATLQVTAMGYAHATGVPGVDARVVDLLTDPPASLNKVDIIIPSGGQPAPRGVEQNILVDPCFLCYEPTSPLPAIERGDSGVSRVRFGSFNSVAKWSPTCIALWRAVLDAVPGAILVLKSAGVKPGERSRFIVRRLGELGLPADRVELSAHLDSHAEHMLAYNQVDVALDTFPYHGTTTTCEALLMGVPVVTLAGDRHAARVGISLLSAAGHPEWVASSKAEYVSIAAGLASLRVFASQPQRELLRNQLLSSPLCDSVGYAQKWEAAIRAAWWEKVKGGEGAHA